MSKALILTIVLFFGVSLTVALTAIHNDYSFSSLLDTHFVTLRLEGGQLTMP